MIRRLPVFARCLVFSLGCFSSLRAQEPVAPDTTVFVLIYTKDGNEFNGKLISESASAVVLHTELLGELTIQRSAIRRMNKIEKPKLTYGRVWFENIHAPRYFVGPSAYGLRKGEGVYENSEIFLNQLSYGLSDLFSLSAGFAPFVIFFDGPFPVWVSPKLSIPLKKNMINLGIGGIYGREYNPGYDGSPGNDFDFSGLFGQLTIGPRDYNITASLGYRTTNDAWTAKPIISLAATARLTARSAILVESYFSKTEYNRTRLFGGGFRFMGRGIALDAGVAVMGDEFDGSYPIPYGTLHVPFGRPKN